MWDGARVGEECVQAAKPRPGAHSPKPWLSGLEVQEIQEIWFEPRLWDCYEGTFGISFLRIGSYSLRHSE